MERSFPCIFRQALPHEHLHTATSAVKNLHVAGCGAKQSYIGSSCHHSPPTNHQVSHLKQLQPLTLADCSWATRLHPSNKPTCGSCHHIKQLQSLRGWCCAKVSDKVVGFNLPIPCAKKASSSILSETSSKIITAVSATMTMTMTIVYIHKLCRGDKKIQ